MSAHGAEKREKRKQKSSNPVHPPQPTTYTRMPKMRLRLSYQSGTDKPLQEMLKYKQSKTKYIGVFLVFFNTSWQIRDKPLSPETEGCLLRIRRITSGRGTWYNQSFKLVRDSVGLVDTSVNIHRYTPITLYPTAPLYDIIIIFDTVLRQKRICEREKQWIQQRCHLRTLAPIGNALRRSD